MLYVATMNDRVYAFDAEFGRLVDAHDVERFLKAESLLPRILRTPYRKMLSAVASPGA